MGAGVNSKAEAVGQGPSAGFLLRLGLSIAILVWVLTAIDLDGLGAAASPALIWSTLGAALLIAATALPAAERWRIIARDSGIDLPRAEAVRVTLLSYFALQFAPSTLGADAVRLASLRPLAGRWSQKTASVLVDRAYGVLSLVLLAPLSVIILMIVRSDLAAVTAVLTVLSVGAVAGALVLSYLRPPRAWLRHRLVRAVARITLAFRRACLDWRIAIPALALSLISHACFMGALWLTLRGAGADAGAGVVLGSFPPAGLLSLAPISINGWGIREASIVALGGAFQISAAVALAASIAFGVANALAGGLGAVAWLGTGARPSAAARLQRLQPLKLESVLTRDAAVALGVCLGLPAIVLALVPSMINQANGFIDPALYTALMYDYGALVERFGPTYYATRVSYIFPGMALQSILGDDAGYVAFRFVLLALWCGGIYFVLQRWVGAAVAVIVATIAVTTPWALRGFFYDYVEGAAIAYLCAGFALACVTPLRMWAGIAAGVLFACAVNTHLATLPYGAAFFVAWLILLNEPWAKVFQRMAAIGAGFVITYAVMTALMYANYPQFGPFFETVTFRTTEQLFQGGAAVWYHPLSAVLESGLFYVFLPFLTWMVLAPLTLMARAAGDVARFRLAAFVQLSIVCAIVASLHFVFRAGVLSHPWAMIYTFPATLMAWAAIIAPSLLSKSIRQRWMIVAAFCVTAIAIFYWARYWLESPIDQFDLVVLGLIVSAAALAIFVPLRPAAMAAVILLAAQMPYRYEMGQTGLSGYFADMHRVEVVEDDVVDGGRALLDLVREHAPPAEGALGLWHAVPSPPNFIGLDGFFFWAYSIVMPEGSAGMPSLDEGTQAIVKSRTFLLLIAPTALEVTAGREALDAAGFEHHVIRNGFWSGRAWGFAYALVRLTPVWERELTAEPEVVRIYDLAEFQQNAGARLTQASALDVVTDPGAGGFSAVLSLGPEAVQAGPVYLRLRLKVSSGRLQFVVTQRDWPADYPHFTMNSPLAEEETTVYVPINVRDDRRLFIVANGSTAGVSAAQILSAELVTRPADAP